MWQDYFDAIFILSLDHCKTTNLRLPQIMPVLKEKGINAQVFDSHFDIDGAHGCYSTHMELFNLCLESGLKNILVFEDDIKFVNTPGVDFDKVMTEALAACAGPGFPYHTLHLGPNTHTPLHWSHNNLLLMDQCLSTHAQAYSRDAMEQIVNYEWDGTPIDKMIEQKLQPQRRCYCTFPLLVTQQNGYSDIEKRTVNMYYIEERFAQNTKHIF